MTASPRLDRDVSKYRVDGCRVPSVTECLALAGHIDFGGVSREVLAAAAEKGRLAHKVTALWDSGALQAGEELPAQFSDVGGFLLAYANFRRDKNWTPLRIEYSFVNRFFRFGGTLDRLFDWKGGMAVLDLKTGASIPKWVGLQLAGYEIGIRPEVNGLQRISRFVLRLLADGSYRLEQCKNHADSADFLAAVRTAHRRLADQHLRLEEV